MCQHLTLSIGRRPTQDDLFTKLNRDSAPLSGKSMHSTHSQRLSRRKSSLRLPGRRIIITRGSLIYSDRPLSRGGSHSNYSLTIQTTRPATCTRREHQIAPFPVLNIKSEHGISSDYLHRQDVSQIDPSHNFERQETSHS